MFESPLKSKEIVIVNNSPNLVRVYEKFFAIAGMKVIAKLASAEEMLSYFHSKRPDLASHIILLDLKMPEMDGVEAARQLKRMNRRHKIILATVEEPSVFGAEDDLIDGRIQKPFTISELQSTIEKVSSPLRMKGSWIFEDPEEIQKILSDIQSDAKEKMCSIRNQMSIFRGAFISGRTPTYLVARTKGLKVFLITEITRVNMYFCKLLMENQGIQIRHLDGVQGNFAIWDEKHSMEAIQIPSNSSPQRRLLYSNLDTIVGKNQYEFDHLWNASIPAEQKIKELEAQSGKGNLVVLLSRDDIDQARVSLIHNAHTYLDTSVIPSRVHYLLSPDVLQARVDAISRGIRSRVLTEVTHESLSGCKKLDEIGTEIRHFPNLKGSYLLNQQEVVVNASTEDPKTRQPLSAIYSSYPEFVDQHKSMFGTLWNISFPFSARMKELFEQEKEIRGT